MSSLDRAVNEGDPQKLAELMGVGASQAQSPQAGPPPNLNIPGYQLVGEISRGGQAIVFEAVQQSTGRKAAVKVLRDGALASTDERARLDREVQVLASLNHPNIVQVLDRGETADGAMYLVTEYVQGRPLDQHLDALRERTAAGGASADPVEQLRLFLKICQAVQAAHARGVVHRDLKPSNIRVDERGEPHILDFGLARAGLIPATDPNDNDGAAPITLTGQFLGSLPWASPEQAEGIGSKIDQRTDVYSLGVILYHILTGTFPYQVAGTMRDVLNNILTAAPSPPSQMLARREASEMRKRSRRLRVRPRPLNPALDAIVLKSLAKRRDDRYASAGELADDITNYLAGRPTLAAGSQRRPPRLQLAAALLVGGILAVGMSCYFNRPRGDTRTAPEAAGSGANSGTGHVPESESSAHRLGISSPQGALPIVALDKLPALERIASEKIVSAPIVAFSPDGKSLYFATAIGLESCDPQTLAPQRNVAQINAALTGGSKDFSADGKYLVGSALGERVLTVWDCASAKEVRSCKHNDVDLGAIRSVSDNAALARGHRGIIVDVTTGKQVAHGAMAPDGRRVLQDRGARGESGVLELLDLLDPKKNATPALYEIDPRSACYLSRDARRIIYITMGGQADIVDVSTNQILQRFAPFASSGSAVNVAFTADGRLAVLYPSDFWTGHDDAVVVEMETGRPIARIPHGAETRFVTSMAISPDGTLIARGADGEDGRLLEVYRVPGELLRSGK